MADPDERNSSGLSPPRLPAVPLTQSLPAAKQRDARIQNEHELSDSEDEGSGGRKHRQDHSRSSPNGTARRRSPGTVGSSKSATPAAQAPTADVALVSEPAPPAATTEDVEMEQGDVTDSVTTAGPSQPAATPLQPAEEAPIFSRHSIIPINGVRNEDVDPVPGGRPPNAAEPAEAAAATAAADIVTQSPPVA